MKFTRRVVWSFFAVYCAGLVTTSLFFKVKFVTIDTKMQQFIGNQPRRTQTNILQELSGFDCQNINQTLSTFHPLQRNIVMAIIELEQRKTHECSKLTDNQKMAASSDNDEMTQNSASKEKILGPHFVRTNTSLKRTESDKALVKGRWSRSLPAVGSDQKHGYHNTWMQKVQKENAWHGHSHDGVFRTADLSKKTSLAVSNIIDDTTETKDIETDSVLKLVDIDFLRKRSKAKSIARISQNLDIEIRSKWQMQQIRKFCQRHNKEHSAFTLPSSTNDLQRRNLFRHLLFDDERKLLFCFIPKVGCTNMRRFFLVLRHLLPLESIHWKRVPEKLLREGIRIVSYLNDTLTDKQRLQKIRKYWKFVIVRNPLERLLSAYINKLSKPVNTSLHFSDYFEMQKLSILLKYKPQTVRDWLVNISSSHNQARNLTVDFETFLRWVVDTPNDKLNEHYAPMVVIAQPCRIRYNFYANFKMYSSEMEQIAKKLKVPLKYFHDQPYHVNDTSTAELLRPYYSKVSAELKEELLNDFRRELEFYYSLYPEERFSHFELLGVREDIL